MDGKKVRHTEILRQWNPDRELRYDEFSYDHERMIDMERPLSTEIKPGIFSVIMKFIKRLGSK